MVKRTLELLEYQNTETGVCTYVPVEITAADLMGTNRELLTDKYVCNGKVVKEVSMPLETFVQNGIIKDVKRKENN